MGWHFDGFGPTLNVCSDDFPGIEAEQEGGTRATARPPAQAATSWDPSEITALKFFCRARTSISSMPLQLAFATKALRQLCEREAKATRQFGPDVAAKLKGRLADLRAASHVRELVAGRPRELPEHLFAIDLCDGYRIVFSPNHNVTPALKDGSVKWDEVRRIQLLRIEKSHD